MCDMHLHAAAAGQLGDGGDTALQETEGEGQKQPKEQQQHQQEQHQQHRAHLGSVRPRHMLLRPRPPNRPLQMHKRAAERMDAG